MSSSGYLSPEFLETLLNMHESETLDFKREQYRIENASDDEKGEFVKDIIAFANSWKTGDAYILIGIEEVPGSRANVIGIPKHIDDAKLQQIVNSKTSVPVRFSYIAVSIDGKQVGVIRIEQEQQRPVCLKKDFGKLKRETVYIRRSSSTAEANVAEIARMGAVSNTAASSAPVLEIGFGVADERKQYGKLFEANPRILNLSANTVSPDLTECQDQLQRSSIAEPHVDCVFGRPSPTEMRDYHQEFAKLIPIELYVKNMGQVVARDVKAELSVPLTGGLKIIEERDHPWNHRPFAQPAPLNRNILLTRATNEWLIEASFGKVQPQAVAWMKEYVYISTLEKMILNISARILDDNLPVPIEVELKIVVSPLEVEYDPSNWIESKS